MIGRLRGTLLVKAPPLLLLDVQGVGYEVEAPMSTFYQLPALEEDVILHTHLIVREDAQILCGFATEGERRLFRCLIRVNGVGAKLALAILSGMSADEFAQCVHGDDVVGLTRLPGVGKKTAERLIIEMRDKLDDWQTGENTHSGGQVSVGIAGNPGREAVSALVALGYRPPEANKMVQKVDTEGLGSEDIIREALRASLKN